MFCQYSFLAPGLTIALMLTLVSSAPTCTRISAAFTNDEIMHFVIGDEIVKVEDGDIVHRFDVKRAFSFNHAITSAFGLGHKHEFYVMFNNGQEGFGRNGQATFFQLHDYTQIVKKFEGEKDFDGIDAVTVMGPDNVVNFFYGCSYVTVRSDNPGAISDTFPNSDIGLPCDLDAALFSPLFRAPIAFKGNKVWVYNNHSSRFSGPFQVEALFSSLHQFNICPNEE